MKILIVSDTHGNIEGLSKLINNLADKIDMIIHLGDDSADINSFEGKGIDIIKVPGLFESHYSLPQTKRRVTKALCGKKFLITHSSQKHSNDLSSEPGTEELTKEADIVLYGHTHIPKIKIAENNKIWLNPGHMKKNDDRGCSPSYALLESENNEIKIEIIDFLTGNIIDGYIYI